MRLTGGIVIACVVGAGVVAVTGDEAPPLEAKPYWIGVAASHVAGPINPIFTSDALWREGLDRVDLYKYYGVQAVGVNWATDLSVPGLVAFCERNGIRIGCEFGNFTAAGAKPMGARAFEDAKAQLDPVVAAGGTVAHLALDGPVCRTVKGLAGEPDALDMDTIAAELVRFFALVRERYPDIEVGLIPNLPNWDYTEELAGFNGHNTEGSGLTYHEALTRIDDALRAAGDRVDFVQVDCPYNYYRESRTRKGDRPVENGRKFRALQQWCEERDAEFQLIVNAEHRGGGGKAFRDMTLEYIRALRRDGVFPDGFIIQSWYDQPAENLPETEPGTFTNAFRDAAQLIERLFPREASD